MRVVTGVAAMQRLSSGWKSEGIPIGFVPTMGFLHHGHLSLARRARQRVGRQGKVVLSIYVNPTQFGPREDFAQYPRDLERDKRLCREAGVDVVFAPTNADMYSAGTRGRDFSTYVAEESLSRFMEGVSRPTHFRGVTTVVAKLFNIVQPTVAVFGAKDFQQAAIIKRMVRDLNFPVGIEVATTVRESDGLAMSSRNKYLAGDLRAQALALSKAIRTAREAVQSRAVPTAQLRRTLTRQIEKEPEARVDYIEFFDPDTLLPVPQAARGKHLALAVFVGKTRLIDNARL